VEVFKTAKNSEESRKQSEEKDTTTQKKPTEEDIKEKADPKKSAPEDTKEDPKEIPTEKTMQEEKGTEDEIPDLPLQLARGLSSSSLSFDLKVAPLLPSLIFRLEESPSRCR
jgi:hypothetical protein